jgi:hypothetical protein
MPESHGVRARLRLTGLALLAALPLPAQAMTHAPLGRFGLVVLGMLGIVCVGMGIIVFATRGLAVALRRRRIGLLRALLLRNALMYTVVIGGVFAFREPHMLPSVKHFVVVGVAMTVFSVVDGLRLLSRMRD